MFYFSPSHALNRASAGLLMANTHYKSMGNMNTSKEMSWTEENSQ